jgi:ion channel
MLQNLAAGSVMVITTVIIHGVGLLALSAVLRSVIERYRPHQTLVGTVVTMVLTVLGLFLLHTLEIWIWAAAYVSLGALPNMTDALFFSTLSFSTLGAESISATPEWQLFGSFEGVNGFLLIGWSTAYLIPAWTRYGPFHEDRRF